MEQRKVLIIILSVTVILAATVAVGLLLFYPRDDAPVLASTDDQTEIAWDPSDFLRGGGSRPGLEPAEDNQGTDVTDDQTARDDEESRDFQPVYGEAEDPDERRRSRSGVDVEVETSVTNRLQVNEAPSASGVAAAQPRPSAQTEAAASSQSAADRSTATSAGTAQPSTQPRRQPSATSDSGTASRGTATAAGAVATRPATSSRSSEPSVAQQAYWVQIISSPNRGTIEQARREFGERQMNSRILTKQIGGTVYYRLRFGPFALRTEAEKFLEWVLKLDGYSDALIFVDYTTRVAAPGT